MVFKGIKFKPFKLGKEKKKKVKPNNWWLEDTWTELDDIEHNYFINKELRRVRG